MGEIIKNFWNGFDAAGQRSLIIILVFIPIAIAGIVMRARGQSALTKFKRKSAEAGRTAVDIGRKMLNDYGLNNVLFERNTGKTDYYDPEKRVIRLSGTVYNASSISAIAIACHEAGHGVKHDEEADFAVMRVKLIPFVKVANRLVFPLLLIGVVLGFLGSVAAVLPTLGLVFLVLAVLCFGASFVYACVSLPLELDASKKARNYLKIRHILTEKEQTDANKALKALSLTYLSEWLFSTLEGPRYLCWLLFMPKDV